MDVDKGIAQKSMVFIWNENLQKGISSHWIVVCLLKKKELLYVWFCSVALNALFCLKKRKLRKNESEVFRVKIPQRKVTKYNTYNNSFFFITVFLQFSIEFYFSSCLVLITNSSERQSLLENFHSHILLGKLLFLQIKILISIWHQ